MDTQMTPTQRMNSAIIEKKLQKKDLAAVIGVPTTTLSSWINRGSDFPAQYVIPISEFLHVHPLWLLTGNELPEPKIPSNYVELHDDEEFLLRTFRALDQEGRVVVSNKAVEEMRRVKAEQGNAGLSPVASAG